MCPTNGFLLSWLMARLLSQSINKAIRSRSYIKKKLFEVYNGKNQGLSAHTRKSSSSRFQLIIVHPTPDVTEKKLDLISLTILQNFKMVDKTT